MANFPSVTAAGAFESTAVQNAIKALAEQAVEDRLDALEYDSGLRDITQLATGIAAGKMFLRVKSGWARVTFIDVVPSAAGDAWLFGNDSALAPWAPTGTAEDGTGAVTLDIGGSANRYPVLHRLTHRGAMAIYKVPANAKINGFIFWPFDRTPPNTPPGAPA